METVSQSQNGMTQESAQDNGFSGWAVVEIFGHQRYAGHVSTQAFGTAVMFRVDVPALESRERVTSRPGYAGDQYVPAGTLIQEGAVQGYTKLFGVGAIYAITPCTQEAALKAVEESIAASVVRFPTDPLVDERLTAGEKLEAIMDQHFSDRPIEDKLEIRRSLWNLHLLCNSKPKVN